MHILRVAQDDDLKLQAVRLLELAQPVVYFVEVVGFGRWTRLGVDDLDHLREKLADFVHLALRLGVVGINADKNKIMAVVDRVDGVEQHIFDNTRFMPGRKHHGHRLFLDAQQLVEGQGLDQVPLEEPAVKLPSPVIKVNKEVVGTANGKSHHQHNKDTTEKDPALIKSI